MVAVALCCASTAGAQNPLPGSAKSAPAASKTPVGHAPAKPTRKLASARHTPAGPQRKASPTIAAGKRPLAHLTSPHRTASAAPGPPGVLAAAGCYGRFIAWRDELAGLMLQAGSYTPWPDDRARFDRMEQSFAASARRERRLTLTLRPLFKESDFPADVRTAFRAGIKLATDRFADGGYRHTQIVVFGQPGLSPAERMAQLEANTDEAFAPLAVPCEPPPAP